MPRSNKHPTAEPAGEVHVVVTPEAVGMSPPEPAAAPPAPSEEASSPKPRSPRRPRKASGAAAAQPEGRNGRKAPAPRRRAKVPPAGAEAEQALASVRPQLEEIGAAAAVARREVDALREGCREALLRLEELKGRVGDAEAVRDAGQQAVAAVTAQAAALREGLLEAGGEVRELSVRAQAACEQQLSEVGRQALEAVVAEAQAAREGLAEAGREAGELRLASRLACEQLDQEAHAWAQTARAQMAATELQWRELGQLLVEGRRQFAAEVERQLQAFRQEVAELRRLIRSVPEEIQPVRQRLRALGQHLPEADRQVEEVRSDLAAIREDLQEIREGAQEVKQAVEQALPPPPEAAAPPEAPAAPPQEARNRLGATVGPGVMVAEVCPGSPAEQVGLARGDIITGVDGAPVVTAEQLRELVHGAGEEITVRLARGGAVEEVQARLAPPPEAAPEEGNRLGVTVAPRVVVAEVEPNSPAERAGLARGDAITAVDGAPVLTAEELRHAVQDHAPGAEVTLEVVRGPQTTQLQAKLEEAPAGTTPAG
jgi:hypothetical protein